MRTAPWRGWLAEIPFAVLGSQLHFAHPERILSGDTYVYSGADQGTFEELLNADSVGSYLNRVIKPNYEYSKL